MVTRRTRLYTAAGMAVITVGALGAMTAWDMLTGPGAEAPRPVARAAAVAPGAGVPAAPQPPRPVAPREAGAGSVAETAGPLPVAADAGSALPPLPRDPEPAVPGPLPRVVALSPGGAAGPATANTVAPADVAPADRAPGRAADAAAAAVDDPETTVARNAFGLPCGPMLSGAPAPAAMVELTLSAPCRADATVEVRAGPLQFTARTDALGVLRLSVPALETEMPLGVRFADGSEVTAEIASPDAAKFTRVALQWQGAGSGLHIHALEFGARYGEPGHVWAEAPRAPEVALTGRGGFLTRLGTGTGETDRLAEVYTYPLGVSERDGLVRLSVEAEITAANCGRDVTGQTLQPGIDGRPESVEISFAMPGCDAIGEFLVLKNVLRDLKVAAN